ncbi:MAG TPA: tetratricopeptide repeat protein [Candidatus Hypogeohydataceae bacterium YC41]
MIRYTKIISFLAVLALLSFATPLAYAQHDMSDDAKAHFNKGHEFYKQGKYDDAIIEFKEALEHDPKDAASLFGLGNCYFLKQDANQAIKCYLEVTKLKPDFAKAHYALALAYRRIGKAEEAEKEFELYTRLSSQKPTEAPKTAEAAKPTVKKVEPPKKTEEAPPQRPTVKRVEPEVTRVTPKEETERPVERKAPQVKRKEAVSPEEVVRKARPSEGREERVAPERPSPRREGGPGVRMVKKPEGAGGGIVSRTKSVLNNWGPAGRFLLWAIYYTFAVQVWIAIVVLLGLIVLWRRH